jgi:hypothetical protein
MSAMYMLWIVWGVFVAILLILLGYRGTLTRYEEDQLFLAAGAAHEAQEQSAVLMKIQRLRPYVQLAVWGTCLLSALIVGLVVWQAIHLL